MAGPRARRVGPVLIAVPRDDDLVADAHSVEAHKGGATAAVDPRLRLVSKHAFTGDGDGEFGRAGVVPQLVGQTGNGPSLAIFNWTRQDSR